MKKLLSLLMAIVLVFSLVACGSNKESEKESNAESTKESMEESSQETMQESVEETETEAETAEKVYNSLVVKDNIVIASQEDDGKQDLYVLKAEDNDPLEQGHKYDFKVDPATIKGGDLPEISVKTSEMLGKSIGYEVQPEVVEKIMKNVEGIKIVDARSAEDFGKGTKEGAVNIPAGEFAADLDEAKFNANVEKYIKGFEHEDVVLVYGAAQDVAVVADLIYKTGNTAVVLNAGEIK
ncbi:rhodanese-like domain-containing protein [Helcococcus kunzii]|uniref:rhodanese-like domain-containing protein n=1 Tax=Helcococcus kunzii TaxID=40091 RepID=UPI0024AD0DEF|nr:rhodanese-like domain-containing protein [Helcococcus kunzii]